MTIRLLLERQTDMPLEDVPQYPDFRQVRLGDKREIESLLLQYPTEVSERTFAHIFIWRNYEDRSRLSHLHGHLVMSWYREKFGKLLFCPVGPDPALTVLELSKMNAGGEPFHGVFAIVEPVVSDLRKRGLTPTSLRDEWDYVYTTKELIELDGPKYHTQRKEMKKAVSQFELVYEPMTKEHQKQCLELEEKWCDLKHCSLDKFSKAEDAALKEAISNFDALGMMGGVILLEGNVQALTAGERLNDRTAVVHFEKANPEIRGLYQVINQKFCENALQGFEFVNREQDVGEPGLRRAKEGYHPHHFVEKHIMSFQ